MYEIRNHPWRHIVTDELLPNPLLQTLKELGPRAAWNEQYGYWSPEAVLKKWGVDLEPYVRCTENMLDRLRQDLEPRPHSGPSHIDVHLAIQRPTYRDPRHNEDIKKLISIVTYISPESGSGTVLYANRAGDDATQVEWKPGLSMIFAGADHTWHDYQATDLPRISLRAFLVRSETGYRSSSSG